MLNRNDSPLAYRFHGFGVSILIIDSSTCSIQHPYETNGNMGPLPIISLPIMSAANRVSAGVSASVRVFVLTALRSVLG